MPHTPVLLHEVVDALDLRPGAFVVDATANGGGHAREILKRIEPGGTLLCVDWDASLIERLASEMKSVSATLRFVHGNYANLADILREQQLPRADGVVLDLGFSSFQLEDAGRGFSFQKDEPLVMTYDSSRPPLWKLLPKMTEKQLVRIIGDYGEERYASRIARAILGEGKRAPIKTTGRLAKVIASAVPAHGRINPATRTFQALRIHANGELENLKKFLDGLPETLAPEGRLAVISFHSLEDGLVKEFVREHRNDWELTPKKPIIASPHEINENPRSRSARLRIIARKVE
jgi:16S rRNA (cytosine1402-N4)-methyltransferase